MRALVVAAHPDDEVLGAGATVAALSAAGWEVVVLIAAEGVSLRHDTLTLDQARENCRAAGKLLGVERVRFGGLAADGVLLADGPQRAVVAIIEQALSEVDPVLVLTHHPGDVHADHRIVADATAYATRLPGRAAVRQVFHFEVLSSTDQQTGLVAPFQPNSFVDVSGFVDAKCEALSIYSYELFDDAHPRSVAGVRTLARYRGMQVGVAEAEAFVMSRQLMSVKGAFSLCVS